MCLLSWDGGRRRTWQYEYPRPLTQPLQKLGLLHRVEDVTLVVYNYHREV